MVSAVEEIKRVYELTLESDDVITLNAVSDNSTLNYHFTFEGADDSLLSVNDTKDLIDMIQRASDWINKNSEETE